MRILIATPLYPPDIGGPAKYAKELHEAFDAEGHAATIVAYGSLERALPAGIRHLVYFFRLLPHVPRADAMLVLDTWSVGLPALAAAALFRKKLLVRIGGDILWESYVERTGEPVLLSEFYETPRELSFKERLMRAGGRLLARHAALLFTTEWQRDIWMQPYELSAARTRVVENEYPEPQKGKTAKGKVFVAAGRDIALKNKKALHEALTLAKQAHPDIRLDERALPPEKHQKRIAECYAVIVPSLSEVNSNTVIEGASAGKPFIMTADSGGRSRLAGAGLYVDTRDPRAVAEAIDALLDPIVYAAYADATRRIRPHSWKDIATEIISAARL